MADLDLAEPVNLIVEAYRDNWSLVPVEVLGSDTRGGFDPGDNLLRPHIIPVEGDPGTPRRGKTKIGKLPGKTAIYIYEVDETFKHETLDEDYGLTQVRITTDIYNIESKARLRACWNECRRIISLIRKSPGGNYNKILFIQKTDLTNRAAGLWRRTFDIYLVKVSDFYGHE